MSYPAGDEGGDKIGHALGQRRSQQEVLPLVVLVGLGLKGVHCLVGVELTQHLADLRRVLGDPADHLQPEDLSPRPVVPRSCRRRRARRSPARDRPAALRRSDRSPAVRPTTLSRSAGRPRSPGDTLADPPRSGRRDSGPNPVRRENGDNARAGLEIPPLELLCGRRAAARLEDGDESVRVFGVHAGLQHADVGTRNRDDGEGRRDRESALAARLSVPADRLRGDHDTGRRQLPDRMPRDQIEVYHR